MSADAAICKYCGKDCGNAGARTNHEPACPENPDNQSGGDRRRRDPGDRRRDVPDRRDGGEIAPRGDQGGAGAALADIGIALFDDDVEPQQRGQALGGLLGLAQQGVSRYNQYRDMKMQQQEHRARNAELEEVTNLPECGECGYQFTADEIGFNDEHVRCPECQKLWRVGLQEGAEAANDP